ncbi:MAG: NADH-quinone oxidoreductase subunit C [Candidatus Cloacimonetes bacterium]|nr:NADH-quinone oxidoreductase subunit C [Candidatus Cloacimonadota bacterium]
MAIEKFIEDIKNKFPENIRNTEIINKKRLMVYIDADALLRVSEYLFHDLGYRYVILSAMDSKAGYEIIYHFSDDATGWIVNLNVVIPRDNPEIESLVPVVKGAEWIEREIHDIIGIKFRNHPNLKRFILAESWEEGNYPYRRGNNQEKK